MNRNFKAIGAAMLAAVMCASLAGCSKKEDNGVYVDKDGNISVNESKFEDHINSVFGGSSNIPSSSVPTETSEPEDIKFAMTNEIKNADLDSGLIQLNNEVFQQGGYITVADFVEKYNDTYNITYMDGSYEERGDYLIEYKDYKSYFASYIGGDELKELYILELTPKSGKDVNLRAFNAVIGNFTSPDEKITLDKAIVIGYRVAKCESGGLGKDSIISEWLPKGLGLTGSLNNTIDRRKVPDDMEMVNGDYTIKSFAEFLEQQGFTLVEELNDDYNKKYLKYSNSITVYGVGDANLFGVKPLYRYTISFDSNTDKMNIVSFNLLGFIE